VFYCHLLDHPSLTTYANGARMVHGGTYNMQVSSALICIILLHGQIFIMGRTSGYWGYGRSAGGFYCDLYIPPSRSYSTDGAKNNKKY